MFSVTIVVDKAKLVPCFNCMCEEKGDYVLRKFYIRSREVINTKFEVLI